MRSRMHADLIGVDIGSRAVKVAASRAGAGTFATAQAPVADGAVVDGLIVRPADVVASIKTALVTAGIRRGAAVAALGGAAVIVRPASLPRLDAAELLRAARWEAQRHIPVPLSEFVIDCAVCGDDPEQPGLQRVVIAGGQRRAGALVAQCLTQAGLRPRGLDADALATYRGFRSLDPAGDEGTTIGLLDLGAAAARLWLFGGGQLRISRSIAFSADRLLSDHAAAVRDLAEEIRRTLEFYLLRGRQIVTDIRLVGGAADAALAFALGAQLSGFFTERLAGASVRVVPLNVPGGPQYAQAVGLALWEGR